MNFSDPLHGVYRTKEEVEEYRQRDPIALLKALMIKEGQLDEDGYTALEATLRAEVDDAVAFAEESPDPDPAELWTDVYTGEG